MGTLREYSIYAREYMANARQFATYRLAREWWERGVPADQAAAWASQGYMPGEAAPLIAAGVTPPMAVEMGQLATDIAGGPEEHAMQEIDRMVAEGTLVDPRRVRLEQDPDDPDHTIVHIQPE